MEIDLVLKRTQAIDNGLSLKGHLKQWFDYRPNDF
jgi:hypothetical protein